MDRWLTRNAPALVLFVALLGAWQLAVSAFEMREYILPSPLVVLRALGGSEIPWAGHLWITTLEIVGAFVLAGVVGVALGIVIAWSPVLAKALVPFLVFVNTLPKVAVAPLFLLWLGYGVVPNMGLELMKTERYAKNGIGWMDDKKMCASVELVNTCMGVPKPVDCKDVYTNEFLTKIELPKSMR